MSGRRGQEGEQTPSRRGLFAAACEGDSVANSGLSWSSREENAASARGAGVAAIHETDLGLAGLDGGQDYAGIIEKERALPDRVPQSERLQVSTCVVAERTGGISQSDALYGRLQQARGPFSLAIPEGAAIAARRLRVSRVRVSDASMPACSS